MKKTFCYVWVYFFMLAGFHCLNAVEEVEPFKSEADVKDPGTPDQAHEFQERYERTAQEISENDEEVEKITKEEDPEKRIKDITDVITALEGKADKATGQEKQTLDQTIDKYKIYKKATEVITQDSVKKLITKYEAELSAGFESNSGKPLTQNEFNVALKSVFENRDVQGLKAAQEAFDTMIDIDSINKKIDQAPDLNAKQEQIKITLARIDDVENQVNEQLKDTGASREYKEGLADFKNSIEDKLEKVAEKAVEVDEDNIDFFTKLARTFKSWVDKNFDFHKPVSKQRSIDSELKAIENNKKTIEPLAKFFDDIENLDKGAQGLARALDNDTKADIMNQSIYDNYEKRVIQITKTIDDLQTKLKPIQDKINKAYNDLRLLTGDLMLKSKRYKGEYPTLYQKELVDNSNEVDPKKLGLKPKVGGKAFGPNEAYESLRLTKDVLGFDPQKYPEKVTLAQIDKAYEEIIRRSKDPNDPNAILEGTYEWKAARNASTILRSRTGKANYDAFLKDFNALRQQGMDPLNPTSKESQEWLNKEGELSKLEISKELSEKIVQDGGVALGDAMASVGSYRSDEESQQSSLMKQLDDAKANLQASLKSAKEKIPGVPVVAPPG